MQKVQQESIYRPILRDAFFSTWKNKYLWFIAIIAGILLTGSVSDIFWKNLNALSAQNSILTLLYPFWSQAIITWSGVSLSSIIIGSLSVLLNTVFFLVIAFAIFGASAICQGTLIHSIGSDHKPSFKASLAVGAHALWPILVLNILTIAFLVGCRSFIAIALATLITEATTGSYLIYLLSFIVFCIISAGASVIQIFAMNAMILQGATLIQGLERGWKLLLRHWVTAIETIAILFLISFGAYVLIIAVGMLLVVPFAVLLLTSAYIDSSVLFLLVTIVFILLFLIFLLGAFGFIVLMHYTTWTQLYKKMGEGGVLPKIHRIVREFTHQTFVPGSPKKSRR